MLFTSAILLALLPLSSDIMDSYAQQALKAGDVVMVSGRSNNPYLEVARERARMLRNNELTTEDPLDNAILYKRLRLLISAYEAGKISDTVLHVLVSEFQTISHTGIISHQMAQEWLAELKLYLK